MQITTVRFMKRKNLGNYEHEEVSIEAILKEGEDSRQAIAILRNEVDFALGNEVVAMEPKTSTYVEKVALKPLADEPAATANFVKEEKPKAKRNVKAKEEAPEADVLAGMVIPPVIQEAAPSENSTGTSHVVGSVDRENVTHVQPDSSKASTPVKGVVLYDSRVKEQRSRFATYLGTTYKNWKTAAEPEAIKEFSLALQGKPFENAKGEMLDSFKAGLEAFFGHAK